MTQANSESDALITARGKAEVTFVVNGAEAAREQVSRLSQVAETAAQKAQTAKARLTSAIDAQTIAENKLANLQALNAKQADAVTQAEIKRLNASAALNAAIDRQSKLQDDLSKAQQSWKTSAQQLAVIQNQLDIATERVTAKELALERAVIQETNARQNALNTASNELVLSSRLQSAKEKVAAATLQLKQAEDNAVNSAERLRGAQQGLQNGLNGTITAKDKLKNKTKELSDSQGLLRNAFNALQSIFGPVTSGLNSVSGGAASALTNLKGIGALTPVFGVLVGAIAAVVTVVGGLAAISQASLAYYRDLVKETQSFANSTGAGADAASVFGISAQLAGTSAKNLSITLGSLNSNLFKLENEFDKAGTKGAAGIQKIQDKIDQLKLDRLQAIARAKEELDAQLKEIDINRGQTKDQAKFQSGQRTEDFNASRGAISQELADRLAEIQRVAIEKRTELEENHNDKIKDLQKDLAKQRQDSADDQVKEEEKLQLKLLELDQKYADKKLGLQERYFNSSPLLRPYLQAAIDNLDKQKEAEAQALKDQAQTAKDKIKAENDQKVADLQERIDRENAEYDKQLKKLEADRIREEQEANRSSQRRLAELIRNYDQETLAAKVALDKQLADYDQQQNKIIEAHRRRLKTIDEEFNQALAKIKTGEDEMLAKPSAAEETPLAAAIRKLGLNFEELRKKSPEEQLFAIAKALESYNGPDKAAIISIIAGLFGVDATNFFITLARAGNSLEEVKKKYKELYPDLVLTREELDKGFDSGVKWAQIGLIADNLKARLGGGLRKATDGIADAILRWYSQPENREKLFAFVDGFLKIVKGIFQTLTDIMTGNFNLTDIIKKIYDPKAAFSLGEDFGLTLGRGLGTLISNVIKSVTNTIRFLADSPEFIASVIQFLASVNTAMARFGLGLIKGIAEGILEGAPDIKRAFEGLLNTILSLDWKKILGILNPIMGLANSISGFINGTATPTSQVVTIGGGAPVGNSIINNASRNGANSSSSGKSGNSVVIGSIPVTIGSADNGQQVYQEFITELRRKGLGG